MNSNHGSLNVYVNLGREEFAYGIPDGCMPLEDPLRPSASWLSRFEHAAETTRAIASRQALTPAVLDMALAREVDSAESRPLPAEVAHCEAGAGGFGGGTADHVLDDTASYVATMPRVDTPVEHAHLTLVAMRRLNHRTWNFRVNTPFSVTFKVGSGDDDEPDSEHVFVQSVILKATNSAQAGFQCLVFVSDTVQDSDIYSWCDSFTARHFNAYVRKRADAPRKPHEPVAFITQNKLRGKLRVPLRCRYVTLRFMPNTDNARSGGGGGGFGGGFNFGGNQVAMERIKFTGIAAGHPLACHVGTPAFATAAAQLLEQLKLHARTSAVWTRVRDAALVSFAQAQAKQRGVSVGHLDAVVLAPSPDDFVRFKPLLGLTKELLQSRFSVLK